MILKHRRELVVEKNSVAAYDAAVVGCDFDGVDAESHHSAVLRHLHMRAVPVVAAPAVVVLAWFDGLNSLGRSDVSAAVLGAAYVEDRRRHSARAQMAAYAAVPEAVPFVILDRIPAVAMIDAVYHVQLVAVRLQKQRMPLVQLMLC